MFNIGTRLFSLKPIGIGTGIIESQTSYISRLSEIHSVTVGSLIGKELASVLAKKYILKSSMEGGSRFFDTASELNGFGKVAEDCAKGLEILTGGTDLKGLTLVSWNHMIPPRGVLREKKAWCPECLENWKENNQDIYEPLLWSFKAVTFCLEHGTSLQNRCPNCFKEIPILTRKTRNGFCSYCGCWLGHSKISIDGVANTQPTSWEYFVVTNVMELLVIGQVSLLHCEEIHAFIKSLVDSNGGKGAFSRAVGIPKTTVRAWYDGNNKPRFDTLLIICFGVKQQLKDIVTGFRGTGNCLAVGSELMFTPKPVKRRRPFDQDRTESVLKEIIDGKVNPPPSVREVAKSLQCDKRLLYKHCSKLCKAVSEKHISYVQECRSKRINEACLKVKDVTEDLLNQGVYPSRRRVEKILGSKLIMREKPVQTTWHDSLQQ
ncbi:MAG: hypothetical protein APF81_11515 [Desulfosporosinus sp. BRH_c37]|nr:MAG: hypothetical protein APF81_11515 [Desulfosporosinus sp. BRH_c37]